jgi:hypothetical protein
MYLLCTIIPKHVVFTQLNIYRLYVGWMFLMTNKNNQFIVSIYAFHFKTQVLLTECLWSVLLSVPE